MRLRTEPEKVPSLPPGLLTVATQPPGLETEDPAHTGKEKSEQTHTRLFAGEGKEPGPAAPGGKQTPTHHAVPLTHGHRVPESRHRITHERVRNEPRKREHVP